MKLFTNKEQFADRPEVYNILTALEKAHTKQDKLSAAILLTRLKNLKISLVSEESSSFFGYDMVQSINETNQGEKNEHKSETRSI